MVNVLEVDEVESIEVDRPLNETQVKGAAETEKQTGTMVQTSLPEFGLAGNQIDRTLSSHGARPQIFIDRRGAAAISIEGFEFIELLGKGGEGEVWKARRSDTDQMVAIKIFNRSDFLGDQAEFNQQRAMAEHLALQLGGEGSPFVSISGSGRARDERPYIVMNLMDHERVWKPMINRVFKSNGPAQPATLQVSLDQYVEVFEETVRSSWFLAGVLQKVHDLGLIHRDIKPDNMAFGEATGTIAIAKDGKDFDGKAFNRDDQMKVKNADGEIEKRDHRRSKLLDTGIMARWREEPNNSHRMAEDFKKFQKTVPMVSREKSTMVIGTPSFTPPEAYEGEQGPWSDQYSFALSMYEMLTGYNPRSRDTQGSYSKIPSLWDALPQEFLEKMKDPSFTVLGMPATSVVYLLSEIIEQGTDLEYSKRHKDMGQMADLLSECIVQDDAILATVPQALREMMKKALREQGMAQKSAA